MKHKFNLHDVGVLPTDLYCRECGWMLAAFKDQEESGKIKGFRVYHSKHETCPNSESEALLPAASVAEMLGIKAN